eukprot:CAMPEP_0205934232 /NCGR_PEP_ID=MMETSP1325-20131115/35759_1 /ASSEMBLY_ACC=CAM_ASM_000708 /TAXON_ID=236786 /ORGANISM="Florenciella sp., Strain RCC1007" /LENGTH=74 /DNA_ID=CAMNT_0053304189 /DNA_START=42 /DNA_END=263 /DNA_ORIENTATION=+
MVTLRARVLLMLTITSAARSFSVAPMVVGRSKFGLGRCHPLRAPEMMSGMSHERDCSTSMRAADNAEETPGHSN